MKFESDRPTLAALLYRAIRRVPLDFKSGDEVRFWLHGDALLVRLHEGIWHLAWREQTVSHERLDHALATMLRQSPGSVVPLMMRLLRGLPESTID